MKKFPAYRFQLIGITVILILLVFLDISFGTVKIPFRAIINFFLAGEGLERHQELILTDFRLPRVMTALLAGAALSVSGLQMQAVFRNPLAGPYVLGISAGASLGAAIALLGTGAITTGFIARWGLAAAAWIGAGGVMLILLLVTIRVRNIMTILILGIMISSAISAIISLLQYFGNATALKSFVIWGMGSLGDVSGHTLQILVLGILPGIIIAMFTLKSLNALVLGEEHATTLGINIANTRTMVFISTSLLAGTTTAFCGPIGFIGIAVPHITRFLTGRSDMRFLMPATMIMGMILMVFSDLISQVPGSDRILPINAITSLIGIPIVIWVVISRKKSNRINS